ncbi:MAG: SMC-Scp complex subunit ScpB, partial [Mesorhizobium sp.]
MSESANASVVPFKVGDVPEEESLSRDPAEQLQNPAERLYLAEAVRMAEAIVFASAEPVSEKQLAARLPDGINIALAMAELQQIYARRGVNLVRVGDAWAFRTAGDLAF